MSRKLMGEQGSRMGLAVVKLRGWLRRVMPRVAVLALVLFVVRVLMRGTGRGTDFMPTGVGGFFKFALVISVLATCIYYGLKALYWMKRKLLWRVRRRLVITYLFVGLTPIVLLGLLGTLAGMMGAAQAMSRIVSVQLATTERQALSSADMLADALARVPPATSDRDMQSWLEERTALLQASLPGTRVAVWRGTSAGGASADLNSLGQETLAQFAAEPSDEHSRGVGSDTTPTSAPLPGWLNGRMQWSGFSFMPPTDDSPFGSPSIRALVRRNVGGRNLAVLLIVPVSRALVEQFRGTTGINLRPYFLGAEELEARTDGSKVTIGSSDSVRRRNQRRKLNPDVNEERKGEASVNLDQFGENLKGVETYIVVLPATNWLSGVMDTRLSFVFGFTLAEAKQQLLENNTVGLLLQKILLITAGVFLFLELLALIAAAWMTRAVTGMVHKLYQATEFIKRGDFSHRIKTRSRDQLGELAVAFNEMSANVEALLSERVEHERLEREVEIAAEVQLQLFPRSVPRLSTIELAGECRAARGVAGDYYDYIEVAPGLVAFALGDVSGKGISASLVMSNLQAALRAQVGIIAERLKMAERTAAAVGATTGIRADAELPCGVTDIDTNCAVANIAENLNTQLCHSTDANRFATLFLALYDDRQRLLRYTNAGHNAAILIRAGGAIERLSEGGTLVGAFDFSRYTEAQTNIDTDDLLLVFSDGISEAQNTLGEEYGEERLAQFAAAHREWSAEKLLSAIFEEVDKWSGAQERGDDQTIVILKSGVSRVEFKV